MRNYSILNCNKIKALGNPQTFNEFLGFEGECMEKRKTIRDMQGLKWDDVNCIHTPEELSDLVEKIGFLPLFRNDIKGFSIEEHTAPEYWWTKDAKRDPWLWRVKLAQNDNLAYGKFFN